MNQPLWDEEIKAATLGEPKQLEFTGKSRREWTEQEYQKSAEDSQDYLAEHWLMRACEETTWGQRKNYPQNIKGKVHTHGARNVACLHQPE